MALLIQRIMYIDPFPSHIQTVTAVYAKGLDLLRRAMELITLQMFDH